MSWLIRASLQFRVIVLMIAIGLIIVGVRTMDSIPLDVFPEFAPPLVEIQTEAPGISTEDVESLISVPIENAVNGIPFVKAVRSHTAAIFQGEPVDSCASAPCSRPRDSRLNFVANQEWPWMRSGREDLRRVGQTA